MEFKSEVTYNCIKLEALFQKYSTSPRDSVREKFHGGDVGGCARKAVLHTQIAETEKLGLETHLYFSIGNAIHETVQKILAQKEDLLLSSEVSVYDDRIGPPLLMPLHGYIDNVIQMKKSIKLVEVKSCGQLPSYPKFWHKRQLNTYMLMTGVTSGFLIYVTRRVGSFGNPSIKIFEISNGYEDAALQAATATVYANAQFLPPIPDDLAKASDCGFCPFKKFCWSNGRLKIALKAPAHKKYLELSQKSTELAKSLVYEMPSKYELFRAKVALW